MNKRLISMLLALALLLGLLGAAAAEPAAALPEPAALPRVGDVVHGFEAVELREFPLMDAVVVRFEHQKTGADLYYIANDDTNRAFDLTFFTRALDNTGLPHVFEHATTSGSEKYPSSALWFNLEYQTYNTFFNAMTSRLYTTYPVSSLSEAQLLKYADYFTDSCFHPTLMENEQVYRTEAWRYRLEDADAPLTIEGTVYSEMLGAWTLQRGASLNALRAMFPGSTVGNDSGGDPDYIPDLTWQALKDYHDLYYHPSNCAAYLYGQFDDYTAFLELLDDCFSAYEKRDFAGEDADYAPIAEPVEETLAFPVEQSSGTEHVSDAFYGFVCPGLKDDREQTLLMNTLTDLLSDDASNFQQSLQEALPYGSFGAYIELDGPEGAIVFHATNINPEDAGVFRDAVDAALRDVAENGFPQDQVDGVMASLKIDALLIRENSNPVEGLILPMAGYYSETGNPWEFMEYQDGLFRMDEWNREGLYAKAVSDWLIDSRTTALVTTYPEPGAKEEKDAALAEKLAGIKAGMTDEEIAAIVEATNTPLEKEDSSEYVASLQAVTVESLPEERKVYDVSDETDASGVRRIDATAGVEGISQANVLLDAAGLAQEDLHWFTLYTDLLLDLDTAEHTKAELAKLTSRYLYGCAIYLSVPLEGEHGYHPYLRLSWIALDDDLDEGYDLMHEILFDTKLDDADKLLEQVQAIRADMKSNITASPFNTIARRALAVDDEMFRYSTFVEDLEYYDFLGEAERLLQDDPDAAAAKLQSVQAYFNNRTNAVTLFAGNADSIALNRQLADKFLASLDERPIERVEYDLPVPARSEALVIDSGAQHNALMACYDTLGLEGFTGDLRAVTSVIDDTFLYPLLRDQYGVYTPMNGAMDPEGFYIYAYRDPNVAETFQVLRELPGMIADMDIDQETLNGYIMSAYSAFAMPQGELSGAINAALCALQGRRQDEALDWMRQLKALTPEALKGYADLYAKLAENGCVRTAGSASAINANADMFDAILNPFGAVDKSQVSFADAPEGSDAYEPVRFVYEQGFMAPLSDDAFGVDEPATAGDLLAAAYALTGGEADADAALAFFAQYGLADADADLSAPIAPEEVWDLLSALVGQQLDPLTQTADPAAVTRGELASALTAFVNGMQG